MLRPGILRACLSRDARSHAEQRHGSSVVSAICTTMTTVHTPPNCNPPPPLDAARSLATSTTRRHFERGNEAGDRRREQGQPDGI